MDMLESKYYRFNKNLLRAIGQWPYEDSYSSKMFYALVLFILVSHLVPQIIKLSESLDDYDLIIECLTPILTNIACLIKFLNYSINSRKMKGLLDHMKKDWQDAKIQIDLDILNAYAENGRKMSKIYTIYILSSATLFCLAPFNAQFMYLIGRVNESQPWKPLYEVEYFVDEQTYIFPIVLHSVVVSYAAMLILVATDSMYMTYVEHACGIFVAVKYRLEHVGNSTDQKILGRSTNWPDEGYQSVCDCLITHARAIEFAELVESAYTVYFFLLLALTVLLISLSGLHTVAKMDEPETCIRFAVLTVGQMFHVFFNSVPGQRLIEHSTAISESVAMAEWYKLSTRAKRLLIIVIMRSSKPCSISAGKLCVLCLESFSKIVQSSMSYFTVLSSVQ